jgi:Glycosyltransferases involved in cell wall biogenesis
MGANQNMPEVSVVMPCLNEAETLATCVEKAARALASNSIAGEIIVADNGSTDGSQAIATRSGSRLVSVRERGYGHALMGGIAGARGEYADDSYDFNEIPIFVEKLRQGFDLVQGCRLPSGGGMIEPGAMPFLHRIWGNPMFSFLARKWFKSPLHDVYCGLRGFRKGVFQILCGYQAVLFAIFTKTFAISEGLLPEDPRMNRFFAFVNLERGVIISSIALCIGLFLLATAVDHWRMTGFGSLDYSRTMRYVIPGTTLTALGFQTILSSFFVSILGMHRR